MRQKTASIPQNHYFYVNDRETQFAQKTIPMRLGHYITILIYITIDFEISDCMEQTEMQLFI